MKRAKSKRTATPRKKKTAPVAAPAPTKGRPRGDAADTEFAAWLDEQEESIPDIAAKVGIAPNSLWSIRRGRQGVSLTVATKLIEYSGGRLTVESFLPRRS